MPLYIYIYIIYFLLLKPLKPVFTQSAQEKIEMHFFCNFHKREIEFLFLIITSFIGFREARTLATLGFQLQPPLQPVLFQRGFNGFKVSV